MATHCNPNVSDITGYVDQHRLPLLSKTLLGSVSPRYFNIMTGVKGQTALNLLGTDVNFTCGSTCGFHPSETTSFTQKLMCVVPLNVHTVFCDKNLLDTWANYEVKVAAGIKNLPFEEEWTNSIVNSVQHEIENFIWKGVSATKFNCENDTPTDEACTCEGIFAELLAGAPSYQTQKNDTPYQRFIGTFNTLPDDVKSANDLIAFVGTGIYYKLIQSIMETSHFHIDGDDLLNGFVFPGTGVRVVPTHALNSITDSGSSTVFNDIIVIGRASNFYYGTDMRGDEEKFDLWYSKDNREFRLAIEFTLGATVAYVDEVAYSYVSE